MHTKTQKLITRENAKAGSLSNRGAYVLKGFQAGLDRTKPAGLTRVKSGRATYRETSQPKALQGGGPSPEPCNPHTNKAVGKASGAQKASQGQADWIHRRGKPTPAQAGEQAGNRLRVLVLGPNQQPLMPCRPARARQLLKAGKAAVFRHQPFIIILKENKDYKTQEVRATIDPGSKITGIALVASCQRGAKVVWAMELHHRGEEICDSLLSRRQLRRGRRSRKTRYREARFDNRRRHKGWMPPSILHRADSTISWSARLQRWAPVTQYSIESVRLDTQLMQNPAIVGLEYQNGTLAGWEIGEFLLFKHGYKCAYCGKTTTVFEVEHMTSRHCGGSNRIINLTLSCEPCNTKKGTISAEEFGFPHLRESTALPLKDAAAVNSTRWALWNAAKDLGLPLETGTGGLTQKNRHEQDYPKAHWIDAACVGISGAQVHIDPLLDALQVGCQSRHSRRMCLPDKYGFPRGKAKGPSRFQGFSTGDLVRATVPNGKRKGKHLGRVAVRSSGNSELARQTEFPSNTVGSSKKQTVMSITSPRFPPSPRGAGYPAHPYYEHTANDPRH